MLLILIIGTKSSSIRRLICSGKGNTHFPREIKSGESSKDSSPSTDHLEQWNQLDATFSQWPTVHACSAENVLLMSFIVTIYVSSRKQSAYSTWAWNLPLQKNVDNISPCISLFSVTLSFILTFIYANLFQ